MSSKEQGRLIAKQNERDFGRGHYRTAKGHVVNVGDMVSEAVAGTVLYTPECLGELLKGRPKASTAAASPRIEVVEGKTGDTGRRLAAETGTHTAVLNFASARNPGGGYVRGARAQEEDLCRCSALYRCIEPHRGYYQANRKQRSKLYTDHIIWSPIVPFVRDDVEYRYLDEPVPLSVITAPAPNAGALDAYDKPKLEETMRRRAGYVLAVAQAHGARNLVLGAWGTGVFKNDPELVADAFGQWLESPAFDGQFDRVVFAIYAAGLPGQVSLEVFRQRFT
jgi:uncharacterized protein (TIGR02452 family)